MMRVKELRRRLRAFHPEAEVEIYAGSEERDIHTVAYVFGEKIEEPKFRTVGIIVKKEEQDATTGHKTEYPNPASRRVHGDPQGSKEAEVDTKVDPES